MISFASSKHFVLGAALLLSAGCSSSTSSPGSSGGPSGTIYFEDTQNNLMTVDVSSGKLTGVVLADMPNVRPSDKWILCNLARNLVFVSPDGSRNQTVLTSSYPDFGYAYSFSDPQLSPDGKYIAYGQDTKIVYIVNASTGALVQSIGSATTLQYYSRPGWGKDGSLYVQAVPYAGVQTGGGIFKVDNTFRTMVRIDQNLNTPIEPKVSPDGNSIAFSINNQLWVMGIDGSNAKQLTSTTDIELAPAWSPDGKWIAVNTNQCDILLVPTDGSAIVDMGIKFPTSIGGGYHCPSSDDQMDWK